MHHFTFCTWIISRTIRVWIYEGVKDTDRQPNVNLAQSGRHQSRSQQVLRSIPTIGILLDLLCFSISGVNSNVNLILSWKTSSHKLTPLSGPENGNMKFHTIDGDWPTHLLTIIFQPLHVFESGKYGFFPNAQWHSHKHGTCASLLSAITLILYQKV